MNLSDISQLKKLSNQGKNVIAVITNGKVTIVELPDYGQVVVRSQGSQAVKISNTTESLIK